MSVEEQLKEMVQEQTRSNARIVRTLDAILSQVQQMNSVLGYGVYDGLVMTAERYRDPRCLTPFQVQGFSQDGDDGIIAEIFRRIGSGNQTFLEIGVGNGRENNTRLLLETGWSGFWVESNAAHANVIRREFSRYIESGRLKFREAFVTKESIGEIIDNFGLSGRLDFLSLDIDQNTSHVWRALSQLHARVACIEYNASIPPSWAFEVEYHPDRSWDGSNLFGAGLKTLEQIGAEQDFRLVGCDFLGVNAFFVTATEIEGKFLEPFTAEMHYEPPRYNLLRRRGHPVMPRISEKR